MNATSKLLFALIKKAACLQTALIYLKTKHLVR